MDFIFPANKLEINLPLLMINFKILYDPANEMKYRHFPMEKKMDTQLYTC